MGITGLCQAFWDPKLVCEDKKKKKDKKEIQLSKNQTKKPNPNPRFRDFYKNNFFLLEFLCCIVIAVIFLDTLACCVRVKSGFNL